MKRFHLISIIAVFLFSFFVTDKANAHQFPDLPNWATEEILYLYERDVVNGLPNGTFGSSNHIKRGDAALMLARAKNLNTSHTGHQIFPDVKDDSYYAGAIESAVSEGYINGFPNGEFRPEATLTREQMAKIITDAYDLSHTGGVFFTDTSASWAKNEIDSLASSGITEGYPDGTFRPNHTISRAEFSVMLARAMNDDFKVAPKKEMFVHFLDVGQGDSIFIQTPDGANILVDAGIRSAGEKVVSYLKEKDVGKLDLVVATHPHADHIGGLIPVLNHYQVDKFVDSGNAHTSQTYIDMLTIIDNKDIPYEIPSVGQTYTFDNNFKITVLHIDSHASNLNNASIVLKAQYNDISFLLTGDAESSVESSLVNSSFNLSSTILKAGHHGSNTSSTQSFLNAVQPEVTILSYGQGNQYGHPHNDVLQRLQAIGSKIYSTAESGNITVKTDGNTYVIFANPMTPPKLEPKPRPQPDPTPDPIPSPGLVNINTASYEELQEITGVGPVIAQRIIDYRNTHGPFKRIEEIMNVSGIAEGRFEDMKHQITV